MRSNFQMNRIAKIAIDVFLITLSILFAYAIKFDQGIPLEQQDTLFKILPLIVGVRFASFFLISRYEQAWRYVSLHDLKPVVISTLLSTLVLYTALSVVYPLSFSRGVLAIDTLLNIYFLLGIRIGFRVFYPVYSRWRKKEEDSDPPETRRIVIVGTGEAAERVARAAQQKAHQGWCLVGFVDESETFHSRRIHGKPVLGSLPSLPDLLETEKIDEVLVAISNLTGERLRDIVSLCENSSVHLSIVPELDELLDGTAALNHVRDIKVEDLLEREPIVLDRSQMRRFLTGQRILVTGAGGSIGGEICRQVAEMEPEVIIMLGRGENSIFEAVNDLKAVSSASVVPVIASIQDESRMRSVFEEFQPTIVFHAAAHKHVPLMEKFPIEAIQNNVFGTRIVASLAEEFGVKKFVLISTDKAVNPTSVMGSSKRLAEMVVQAKASKGQTRTEFVAVRFGNVLGSRGSVVPTMQKQIQRGGPVYITHPEMTRYFMTIPEAVQLVLQAGAMGNRGEVFVLDMGSPVKIMDLARNLIRLSGKVPGRDIDIQIVGARPGEKLHEELLTAEEGISATRHSRIFVAQGQVGKLSRAEQNQLLLELEEAVAQGDEASVKRLIGQAIPSMRHVQARGPII
jgi:FlaA1/EpsC-like NDP-sugar epimerase